ADVGKQNGVIGGEAFGRGRKRAHRLMRRHVGQIKGAVLERGNQRLRAEMKGHAAELVEALVMRGRAHPAFAGEENFLFVAHQFIPYLPARLRGGELSSLRTYSSPIDSVPEEGRVVECDLQRKRSAEQRGETVCVRL